MQCWPSCENVWPTNCMPDSALLISPRLPWKTSAGCKGRLRRPMRLAMSGTSPLPSVSCVKLSNVECSATASTCVLRDRPSHCQPTTSAALHVPKQDCRPCHAKRNCLRQSIARHDLQQNDTARCNLISLSPCGLSPNRSEPNRSNSFCMPRAPFGGRGGLPAKAEWLERRKGWPLQWRRLSFPGSLLPPHAWCS